MCISRCLCVQACVCGHVGRSSEAEKIGGRVAPVKPEEKRVYMFIQ